MPTGTGESIKFETGHVPTGEPTKDSSPAETGTPSAGGSASGGGGSSASQTGNSGGSTGSGSGNGASASRTGSSSSSTGSSNNGGSNNGGSNNGGSGNGRSSESSSGVASGAKIGIGVGVAVGLLLVIAIIAAILLRRRKRRRTQAAAAAEIEKGDKKDASLTNGAAAGRPSDAAAADPRLSDVTGGTEKTNNVSEADGKPLSGADKPGVTELDSEAVMEVSGQTAHPWDRGAELDGKPLRKVKPASPQELPGSLAAESPPEWVVR